VPVFSQWHPLSCKLANCHHEIVLDNSSRVSSDTKVQPECGIWYVHNLEDTNHTSIVPVYVGNQQQVRFWTSVGQWLCDIDSLSGSRCTL
jgi:hypothetical protein